MRQPQRRGQRRRPKRRRQLKLLVLLLMSNQTGEQSHSHRPEQHCLNMSSVIMQTILKRQLRVTSSLARRKIPSMRRCNHLRHHRSIMTSVISTTTRSGVNPAPPKRISRRLSWHGIFTWSVRPEPKKLDAGKLFDKFMKPPSTSATSESGAQASDGANKAPRFTAQSLVNAAKRADARQDSGHGMADISESHGLLPPPPPPPPEQVQTMCPTPCGCGKPCARIERMLRQQQACAYARTRLKRNNHTCDECQQSWYAAARGPRRHH